MAASVLLLVPGFPLINAVPICLKATSIPDWHAGRSPVSDTGYLRRRGDGTDDLGATRWV